MQKSEEGKRRKSRGKRKKGRLITSTHHESVR
jgi:hypothetical protein